VHALELKTSIHRARSSKKSLVAKIISEEKELGFKNRRAIDKERLEGCARDLIAAFFEKHGEIIRNTPPELLFGCDESMLECQSKTKVVVPIREIEGLSRAADKFPHISAMLAHSACGIALPPFILLSNLVHLPSDLTDICRPGNVWIASTAKGWQTRMSFIYWTLCFTHWLSNYRMNLPPELRMRRGLLISDGHSSRGCPSALMMLMNHNMDLLILPSHTSHVLQMYDVVLASPFKHFLANLIQNCKDLIYNHIHR
jgi:hypothetical protein